jgi:hypothetical protein
MSLMKLRPDETDLVGRWISENGQVQADDVCKRIEALTANQLKKIAVSKEWGAWETLFQDPDDQLFWERTYPQGDTQGGGPPRLTVLSPERANSKYSIV